MAIVGRRYETDADLRVMQALQQELWALEGPRTSTHIGDLAWWATMHAGREQEWKRQLWLDGDRCVAWAWLRRPASLDYEVQLAERGGALHEDVLDWFESQAEGDGPLSTYLMDGDDVSTELLARRGFAEPPDAKSYVYHLHDQVTDCCKVEAPDGFTLRTVCPDDDLRERMEVHRAAWNQSRVTEESYRNVMRVWPYRADLDCVLEAPGGTFAAYVLCWYDEENRVGEFEPVGTHRDYRRRGFGALVCRFALQRLCDVGAQTAVVYADAGEEGRAARALYESVGFQQHTRVVELRNGR